MARLGRGTPFPPRLPQPQRSASTAGPRSTTESAPAIDTTSRTVIYLRSLTESAPAGDVTGRTATRSLTESAGAVDTTGRTVIYQRTLAESASAGDATSRTISIFRSTAESAGAVDTMTRTLARFLTESAPAIDSTSRRVSYLRSTTESASAIDSVSTVLVGAGVAATLANPNWPLSAFEIDFTAGAPNMPSTNRSSINAAFRRLAVRSWSSDRGRQYELDQVQAGVATLNLPDPLEFLNPDNPGSPFNAGGNVLTPYRAMWIWAMWPNQPGCGNIINPLVSSTYDASFEATAGAWAATLGGGATATLSTTQAWTGVQSLRVVQISPGAGKGVANRFATVPGITYTFSCYVYPTGGATAQARVVDELGNVIVSATATTQNVWTRLFLAWNPVDTCEMVEVFGSGVSTPTFFVDGTQLEFGSNLTSFTTSGPTLYPIFTGYVERFPTTYDMGGARAQRPLQGVDALAMLSRVSITQSYERTIAADSPVLYFPLNNDVQPASAAQFGPGFGGSARLNAIVSANGQINWGGDSFPDGTAAVSVTAQNPNDPPTLFPLGSYTEMALLGGKISLDLAAGFSTEVWAKWTAGTAQVGTLELISLTDPRGLNANVPAIGSASFSGVQLYPFFNDGTTFRSFNTFAGIPPDGQWHHLVIQVGSGRFSCVVDGVGSGYYTVGTVGHLGLNTFYMEASSQYAVAQAQVASGRFAVYAGAISTARAAAHYKRGIGYAGEKLGARAARILSALWTGGSTRIAAGSVRLAADHGYDTRTVLDVLNEMCETERSIVYADRSGVVVVEDRASRYASQVSPFILGENPPGASPVEYPYEDYKTDHDPTYVFSEFDLTRPDNSDYPPLINSAVQDEYGQRIATQTVQVITDFDLDQAGIFYSGRYSAPKTRITTLTLRPSANPALWPIVLRLEISQRIRIRRRSAFLFDREFHVEKVSHKADSDTGDWVVDIQCSPVFVPSAWVLGDSTRGVLGATTTPIY